MQKIKFVKLSNVSTTMLSGLVGRISTLNCKGDFISDPPGLDEARNMMQHCLTECLGGNYKAERMSNRLEVQEKQNGVYLVSIGNMTGKEKVICGFEKIV